MHATQYTGFDLDQVPSLFFVGRVREQGFRRRGSRFRCVSLKRLFVVSAGFPRAYDYWRIARLCGKATEHLFLASFLTNREKSLLTVIETKRRIVIGFSLSFTLPNVCCLFVCLPHLVRRSTGGVCLDIIR